MKMKLNQNTFRDSNLFLQLKNEEGFVFVVTAVIVSVLLGFTVLYVSNSVTVNVSLASESYSSAQAHWTALSGIEFVLEKKKDGTSGIAGSYTFWNSNVTISQSSIDRFGSALEADETRFVSTAVHGSGKRIMEVTLQVAAQSVWPSLSVIQESDDEFKIEEDFTLNDSLYIGNDVEVDEDASIGDSPGDPTHIYVPSGKEVDGDFDGNFSWSVHPDGSLNLPSFSFSQYDSLIDIAKSISSTSGNKYKGNYTLNGGTFDMSVYDNNTFFIKGKLKVKGGAVTGGSVGFPGIIVVTNKIKFEEKDGNEVMVYDNIIFISDDKIELKDDTQFGVDRSGTSPGNRPKTVNELYADDKVKIGKGTEVWAQVYSSDEIEIKGKVYGIIYSTKGLKFEKEESFLEGAVFVKELKEEEDELKEGSMNLNHYFPLHYFSGIKFVVVPYSLREI